MYRIKCGEKPCLPCRENNVDCVSQHDSGIGIGSGEGSGKSSAQETQCSSTASLPLDLDYALSSIDAVSTSYGHDAPLYSSPFSAELELELPSLLCTAESSPTTSSFSWAESRISWAESFRLLFQGLGRDSINDGTPPNLFPVFPQAPKSLDGGFVPDRPKLLSRDKKAFCVRVFWKSWSPLFPLMAKEEFEALCAKDWGSLAAQQGIEAALIDGLTALGLRSCHAAGVGHRILELWPNQIRQTSQAYFTSCRERLRDSSSNDTVNVVRCYILLILYELQANRVNSAYYMAGLGVRRAYMGKLHQKPPAYIPTQEAIGRARTWWLLHWLDIHCSTQLDRPPAVFQASITYPPPLDTFSSLEPGDGAYGHSNETDIDSSAYILFLHKLNTVIMEALNAIAPLAETSTWPAIDGSLTQKLADAMKCLEGLFAERPERLVNTREKSNEVGALPAGESTEQHFSVTSTSVKLTLGTPDWLQRQRIILELHYLNARVLLQRPCIFLRQYLGATASSDGDCPVKQYGEDAVQSAISIISLLNDIYTKSEILDGLTMAYQYLWTAITAIAAQIFVGLGSPEVGRLSKPILNAVTIMESLASTNSEAAHVYKISRALVSQLQLQEIGELNDITGLADPRFSSVPGDASFEEVMALALAEQNSDVMNHCDGDFVSMD